MDNAQRLTQVLNQQGTNVISQHTYTLDNVGNRTALADALAQVGGGTTTNNISYSYDLLCRLTGDGTRTYGYDPVGNRLTQDTTSYTYDRADRILTAGSTSYTVNANGNVAARGADTFVYDQANRLTSAKVNGTTTTYAYDGDGKRASQTVGTATTGYTYDVNTSLPEVLTDGTLKYVYGLSLAYAVDSSGNVQVYHTDGLGSVRAITDGSGTVIETYQTDPFGVPTQTQGSSAQPLQYTGQQRDANGLIYLRARYYDPGAGRFMSRDALSGLRGAPQTLNRYAYVTNNPVRAADPSGLCGLADEGSSDPMSCSGSGGEGGEGFVGEGGPGEAYAGGLDTAARALEGGQASETGLQEEYGPPNEVGDQAVNQVSRDSYRLPVYEPSPKHGQVRRGDVSPAPTNGQAALDTSVPVSPNTTRRVGIDYKTGEFVVFDETGRDTGVFHGHVRTWNELTPQMRNALRDAGMVTRRGKIITAETDE